MTQQTENSFTLSIWHLEQTLQMKLIWVIQSVLVISEGMHSIITSNKFMLSLISYHYLLVEMNEILIPAHFGVQGRV